MPLLVMSLLSGCVWHFMHSCVCQDRPKCQCTGCVVIQQRHDHFICVRSHMQEDFCVCVSGYILWFSIVM